MRSTRLALTVACVALLAAGPALASNMGFKLNYTLSKSSGTTATNYVSIPYFWAGAHAQDVCDDITGATEVGRYIEATDTTEPWTCGGFGIPFSLTKGQGVYVKVASDATPLDHRGFSRSRLRGFADQVVRNHGDELHLCALPHDVNRRAGSVHRDLGSDRDRALHRGYRHHRALDLRRPDGGLRHSVQPRPRHGRLRQGQRGPPAGLRPTTKETSHETSSLNLNRPDWTDSGCVRW